MSPVGVDEEVNLDGNGSDSAAREGETSVEMGDDEWDDAK